MSQPTIRIYGDGRLDRLPFQVKSSTVLSLNDLVYASANYIYKATAATHDAKAVGFVMGESASGDTDDLNVSLRGFADIDTVSATYTIGQALAITSANTLVTATPTTATVNVVAWAAEAGSSATRLLVMYDFVALNKFFSAAA